MFAHRSSDIHAIDKQAALCHRVLDIYMAVGQEGTLLDADSWELFLRLLLGITDSLLGAPSSDYTLASRLCAHVLKVERVRCLAIHSL